MSLSGCSSIESLEIDCPPGLARLLSADHHPGAPGIRSIDRNLLQYPDSDITIQLFLHFLLEMYRDGSRTMNSYRLCCRIHKESQRRRTADQRQLLIGAGVER
jgi:hypothetical protein